MPPTGYVLSESLITQRSYVGFDGLTPPTLPAPPWNIFQGTQPGDFTLLSYFTSVALAVPGVSSIRVYNTNYPVSAAQQAVGFRLGGYIAFGLNNGTSVIELCNVSTGAQVYRCQVEYDATSKVRFVYSWPGGGSFATAFGASSVDVWQFVAMEVYGNVVRCYKWETGAPTGGAPPTDNAETVTLVNTGSVASTSGATLLPGIASQRQNTLHIHEFITFFAAPPVIASPTTQLGGGGNIMPFQAYNKYKSLREATQIYNNLILGA